MKEKVFRYIGLAKRAGMLFVGYNTCTTYIQKNKLALVIVAEDAADNTKKKFESLTYNRETKLIIWGNKDELSHAVGTENSTVFGITDEKFAEVIESEIIKCCDKML